MKAFFVNLDQHEEERKAMFAEMDKLNLEAVRVPGVLVKDEFGPSDIKRHQEAVRLAMVKALRTALEHDEDSYLISQDGVRFKGLPDFDGGLVVLTGRRGPNHICPLAFLADRKAAKDIMEIWNNSKGTQVCLSWAEYCEGARLELAAHHPAPANYLGNR